jgi:hypothetical protein
MPAPTISPLPTPPSRSTDPANFAIEADAFVAALPEFQTDANAQAVYLDALAVVVDADAAAAAVSSGQASAAAQTAINATGAVAWVSGTTYEIGTAVYSTVNFQTYRRRIAGAGTTDPSLDNANWQKITSGVDDYIYVSTNYNAQRSDRIMVDTSGGVVTITLPSGPSSGDSVFIADAKDTFGTSNCIVARNGATIDGLAEDMNIDIIGVSVMFIWGGTTWQPFAQIGGNAGAAVQKPASSADNGVALFNGTSGGVLKEVSGLGTSGQALVSQGAGLPPIWGDPAASGAFVLLSTQSVTNIAQVDFINLNSTYLYYFLVCNDLKTTVTGDVLLRTSTDNGVTFASAASNYSYNRNGTTTTTNTSIPFGNFAAIANTGSMQMFMFNMGSALSFPRFSSIMNDFNTNAFNRFQTDGIRSASAAINAIRITSSGNLSGTFKLYGVRN